MMLGQRPHIDDTIERIDYNKGYVPGNVKWASRQEQVLNKSDNVVLEIDGVTKTVSQWAEESPVSGFTIYKRIKRGWLEKYGSHRTVFTKSSRDGVELESEEVLLEQDSCRDDSSEEGPGE